VVVGGLTVAINGYFVFNAASMVEAEFKKEIAELNRKGMVVDKANARELQEQAVRSTQLINGIAVVLGVAFVVFGLLVYQYPVPITITSLILYIGAAAAFGLIDPSSLWKGILIKIIIVVALFKAIQSAIAYERDRRASEMSAFDKGAAEPPVGLVPD
jgi:hypothetical protein